MNLPCALLPLLAALLAPQNRPDDISGKGKGVDMDYGPFLTSSVAVGGYKSDADLLAAKTLSIRLAPGVTYGFDTDLLRAAGGWTGGYLDLSSTHLTSYKGSLPTRLAGALAFRTPVVAGWRAEGTPADPRTPPYGPIPVGLGRYEGLFLHGDRVVLSYTVRGCPVLELPGYEDGAFTRTFRMGPSTEPLTLILASVEEGRALHVRPEGVGTQARLDGCEVLMIPPLDRPVVFKAALGGTGGETLVDPGTLVRGGPARWRETLKTAGSVSKAADAFVVDTIPAPEQNPWKAWLRFTGMDFFSDGRAALCTWNGDVWTASGLDAGLAQVEWRRFATGLYEPLGLRIVGDLIHVLGRDQITRLKDLDGDGEADAYENFWNGLVTVGNYHAFAFELHTDSKGNFYCSVDGQRVDTEVPLHGCLLRISPDGRRHEIVARGLRAPNGMSVGPGDEITVSDNQGNWIPSSRVNLVKPGGFYGFVPHSGLAEAPKEQDPPLCWLPMGWDNSSGGQIWVTSDRWGPLKGSLLHTSYGTASLFLLPYEVSGGVAQGGAVRFPLSFPSGIMRGRFHPVDGQLYLAGLKGWQTTGTRDAGFFRVRWTGRPVAMIKGMRATSKGLDLSFSAPLDRDTVEDADSWGVLRWNYLWSEKYGSAEYSVENPKKQVRDGVELTSVKLSADGLTVSLEYDAPLPVMQMLVKARIRTADGAPLPVEAHFTINRVP
jgi:hypothetical protein